MNVFRVLTNGELRQALSHVHLLAHVRFAEVEGVEVTGDGHDPSRSTVNRLIDSIPYDDPAGECWVAGASGLEPWSPRWWCPTGCACCWTAPARGRRPAGSDPPARGG